MPPAKSARDEYLARLPAAPPPPQDLDARLDALVAAAMAAHPEVAMDPTGFLAHVASRVAGGGTDPYALGELRAGPLHLAAAILAGERNAVEVFERAYFGAVKSALARLLPPGERAEVEQQVRIKLFVGGDDAAATTTSRARIADYTGVRDVEPWLHVVAARTALDHRRAMSTRAGRERAAELTVDDVLAAVGGDAELDLIRAQHADLVKQAFAAAITLLPGDERTLLRQHLLDGLTIDDLASLHRIHRVTASRWLVRARTRLVDRLRDTLATTHGLSPASVDSLLRLLASTIDLSLERVLGET